MTGQREINHQDLVDISTQEQHALHAEEMSLWWQLSLCEEDIEDALSQVLSPKCAEKGKARACDLLSTDLQLCVSNKFCTLLHFVLLALCASKQYRASSIRHRA